MTDNLVISIGRQFGAGGRKLGHILADRLGLPYFDKELLSEAAARFGFHQDIFAQADEKRPSIIHALLNFNVFSPTGHFSTSTMNAEDLYSLQSKVIRQLAVEGPCVIVGRTADYILRDDPNLVSVFVHADIEVRAQHILDRGDASSITEAIALAQRRDKLRSEYYNYFSGRKWGDAASYSLCVDSSKIPIEAIADVVLSYLKAL